MTGRERFRVGHVQAGRGDLALVQRSDKRLGVDDTPARDVDQDRPPLHHPEFLLADHLS